MFPNSGMKDLSVMILWYSEKMELRMIKTIVEQVNFGLKLIYCSTSKTSKRNEPPLETDDDTMLELKLPRKTLKELALATPN